MNVDHALRDYYDDRHEIRHFYYLFWGLLFTAFIFVTLDAIAYALVAYVFSIVFVSVVFAKSKDGYHRRFWDLIVGIDGVSTERKRELLEDYRVTDESDLEDLER